MALILNNSLQKFKQLVERDLSSLSSAWCLLNNEYGDLVVDALLKEKREYSETYITLGTVVNRLESIVSYPGLSVDYKDMYSKTLAYRSGKKRKSGTPVKDKSAVQYALARVAGMGNLKRGQALLGIKLPSVKHKVVYKHMTFFFKGMTIDGYGKTILNCLDYLVKNNMGYIPDMLRQSGSRSKKDRQEFESMCRTVFLDGRRVAVLENGRYFREREAFRDITKGVSSGEMSVAASKLGPIQRWVYTSCFGPIETELNIPEKYRPLMDKVVRTLPYCILRYTGTHFLTEKMEAIALSAPSTDRQEKIVADLERDGVELPSVFTYAKGRSIRSARYSYTASVKCISGYVDKSTLGLKGRLAVLSDTSTNHHYSTKDLKKYAWILCDKDIALLSRVHVKGKKQREVAKEMGVSQGAISHRLTTARIRMRLADEIGRLPTFEEVDAFTKEYIDQEILRIIDPAEFLWGVISAKGKQVEAAMLLGISQPCISTVLKKIHMHLLGRKVSPEHARVQKIIDTLYAYPYALQSVHLPHFKWNTKNLKKFSKEGAGKK